MAYSRRAARGVAAEGAGGDQPADVAEGVLRDGDELMIQQHLQICPMLQPWASTDVDPRGDE